MFFLFIGAKYANSCPIPEDGTALNEVFSYEVIIEGNILTVSFLSEGKPNVTQVADMSDSCLVHGGELMSFKTGIYNLKNTGDDDYSQATFQAQKSCIINVLLNNDMLLIT